MFFHRYAASATVNNQMHSLPSSNACFQVYRIQTHHSSCIHNVWYCLYPATIQDWTQNRALFCLLFAIRTFLALCAKNLGFSSLAHPAAAIAVPQTPSPCRLALMKNFLAIHILVDQGT
jgi:hypothetical protein